MMPHKFKILVVDDDPHIVALVTALIERYCEVPTAISGVESVALAIECLGTQPFDLVISDYQMPDQDGLHLVTWVQANHPGTPVILTSGFGDLCAASLHQLGVFAFVAKPFDAGVLMRKVRKALKGKKDRWLRFDGQPGRRVEVYCNHDLRQQSWAVADVLGTGGMIVAIKRQVVMRGDCIYFLLKSHPGSELTVFEGVGTVAWVEPQRPVSSETDALSTMTCGIEFEHLDEQAALVVQQTIAKTNPKAFIPYLPLFAQGATLPPLHGAASEQRSLK